MKPTPEAETTDIKIQYDETEMDVRYMLSKKEFLNEMGAINSGDTVLVKASRGMKFEDIVSVLIKRGRVG
ncbi:MAG: hypothetical protein FWD01_00810 [Defluviitaleaceae bacterium]|nr:hypothetical protein [Defluviitaleaceae bacterium]